MKPINLYLDEAIDRGLVKNDSELSSRIGVTRTAVSNWRSGKRTPDDDEAVRLADLLGKDAGELLAECGAARAKTPETRRAWERIAARMAATSITLCALIIPIQVNKLLFSEPRRRRFINALRSAASVMTECIAACHLGFQPMLNNTIDGRSALLGRTASHI